MILALCEVRSNATSSNSFIYSTNLLEVLPLFQNDRQMYNIDMSNRCRSTFILFYLVLVTENLDTHYALHKFYR